MPPWSMWISAHDGVAAARAVALHLLRSHHASHGGGMSNLDASLIAIAGIVVSGVVGPQLTAWATRNANRKQFNRDQNARRRDDLRALLDEAAVLLASGATNLRHAREGGGAERATASGAAGWASEVFPLGQRLRLRLPEDHQVVKAYDEARTTLVTLANSGDEADVAPFEAKRAQFLDLARQTLDQEIPEDGEVK